MPPALRAPAAAEVHLWLSSPDAAGDDVVREYTRILPEEDVRAAGRAPTERERRLRLISRGVMRSVLASYMGREAGGLRFGRRRGRPQVEGGCDVAFSLAHTDGLIAFAVSAGGPIGVDVERLERRDPMRVARRFFSAEEAARLQGVRPERQATEFLEHWVLKEAYVKAIGRGISLGLGTFSVRLDGGAARLERGEAAVAAEREEGIAAGSEWRLALLEPSRGYRLGLAAAVGAAPRIVIRGAHPRDIVVAAPPTLLACTPGVRVEVDGREGLSPGASPG